MEKRSITIYEKMLKNLKIEYEDSYSSREMIMDSPDKVCPNPKNHLYMNKNTGLFICHRCGLTGNAVTLLTIIKRISYKAAKAILSEGEAPTGASLEELKLRAAEVAAAESQLFLLEESKRLKNIILPPRDAVSISRNRYPTYLKRRRVPFFISKLLGVKFCNSGRYASRIIFPFSCAGHKSFVAYSTGTSAKKTLNPPGSYNRDLLFGYDFVKALQKNADLVPKKTRPKYRDLVVVEGIFDFIRMTIYGYHCVALLKSFLSKSQAILLNDLEFKTITFMLDGDVKGEELTKKLRFANMIEGKSVQIATIQDSKTDPDMLSAKEAAKIIAKSSKNLNYFSQLKERAKKIKKSSI